MPNKLSPFNPLCTRDCNLLESLAAALVVYDENFNVVFMNNNAKSLLEANSEEVTKLNLNFMLSKYVKSPFHVCLNGKEQDSGLIKFTRRDGNACFVKAIVSKIKNTTPQLFVGILLDETEKILKREQERTNILSELKELKALKEAVF